MRDSDNVKPLGTEKKTEVGTPTPMTQAGVLDEALSLARVGVPVFPVRHDKKPPMAGGFHTASTDPAQVRELWRRWPQPLIGIATGQPSGFDILDIDFRNGAGSWWYANVPKLPVTLTIETRQKGLHLYLKHAAGVRCWPSKIAPGVDTKGDGGYGVWWPAAGCPVVVEAEIAPWPDWLLRELLEHQTRPEGVRRGPHAASDWMIEKLIRDIGRAAEGTRNDTLFKSACGMLRMVGPGLTLDDAREYLRRAAEHAGLDDREIAQTIASAFTAVEREASDG